MHNLTFYISSWPYLDEVGKLEIPKPKQATTITPYEVHFAEDLNTLYVIADYAFGSNTFHGISKIIDINESNTTPGDVIKSKNETDKGWCYMVIIQVNIVCENGIGGI